VGHGRVSPTPAADLKTAGKPAGREAGRNGDGRLAAVVERVAERPAEMRDLAAGDFTRADDAERKCRQADGRSDQQVIALEEPSQRVDESLPRCDRLDIVV